MPVSQSHLVQTGFWRENSGVWFTFFWKIVCKFWRKWANDSLLLQVFGSDLSLFVKSVSANIVHFIHRVTFHSHSENLSTNGMYLPTMRIPSKSVDLEKKSVHLYMMQKDTSRQEGLFYTFESLCVHLIIKVNLISCNLREKHPNTYTIKTNERYSCKFKIF